MLEGESQRVFPGTLMPKFKIGDRVQRTNIQDNAGLGTVVSLNSESYPSIVVHWDPPEDPNCYDFGVMNCLPEQIQHAIQNDKIQEIN